ncbi:serine hydrolase [Amycolatopsis sp. NPDC049691]|uniref:serine hydrolase n=1 Tax=Amycolatopsis sp. NPDC049691 TaxID=3155155 RepID=UPI00343FCF3C
MRVSVLFVLVCVVVGALTAAVCLRPVKAPAAAERPVVYLPPATATAAPEPADEVVSVDVRGEWSWALRDLGAGAVVGDGTLRTTTASMIEAWLAVDYLASRSSRVPAGDEARVTRMVRDGDDRAAQTLYRRLGGDASITRMVRTCGLRDTRIHPGRWAMTTMSAADASLLGRCVARGPGLSPPWRAKLLDLMRPAGAAAGIPEAPVFAGLHPAVGNGWTRQGNWWAVHCLAIWDRWVLAVLVHYPEQGTGHRYGTQVCKSVAQQLFGRTDPGVRRIGG